MDRFADDMVGRPVMQPRTTVDIKIAADSPQEVEAIIELLGGKGGRFTDTSADSRMFVEYMRMRKSGASLEDAVKAAEVVAETKASKRSR